MRVKPSIALTWIRRNGGRATCIVVVCTALWGAACSDGAAGPREGRNEPAPGLVVVDNRTSYAVEVAYLHPDEDAEAGVVRVVVGPGARVDVGGGERAGGTRLELDLVLLVPEEEGLRVRRKAPLTVDGDVEVVLELEDADDPFSLQIRFLGRGDREAAARPSAGAAGLRGQA